MNIENTLPLNTEIGVLDSLFWLGVRLLFAVLVIAVFVVRVALGAVARRFGCFTPEPERGSVQNTIG